MGSVRQRQGTGEPAATSSFRESIVSTIGIDRDQANGRPLRFDRDLTDEQLAEELVVAVMARAQRRIDRFRALLAERERRSARRSSVPQTHAGPR
jgi:hypothetical protein